MALNTSKCNHLTPLRFKGLKHFIFVIHLKNFFYIKAAINRMAFTDSHTSELHTLIGIPFASVPCARLSWLPISFLR